MKKRFNYTDLVFAIALILTLLFLGSFLFLISRIHDETFYLTVPLRLINGESLVQNEWHMTQFSSFFNYLPTLLWVKLTGSTDGIILFSRCVYLAVQTTFTCAIYCFFRKLKLWAVIAAIYYFTQSANMLFGISYHSMFIAFTLVLGLSVISAYTKDSKWSYISIGFFYGLACVCNPLFCLAFVLYFASYVMWKYKKNIAETFFRLSVAIENRIKQKNTSPAKKKNTKKKSLKDPDDKVSVFLQKTESYNCLFSKKALCYSLVGIMAVTVIAVSFFLGTGGTISSIFSNLKNLFASSEYTSLGLSDKFYDVYSTYRSLALSISLIFILLLIDKNRTKKSHKFIYVSITFMLITIYATGIAQTEPDDLYLLDFTFHIFSLVCYIVTKNKNKVIFNCMWLPCSIAAFFHLLSSASMIAAFNLALTSSNIAGVFFIADLFKEITHELKSSKKTEGYFYKTSLFVLCGALSLQIFFHLVFYQAALFVPDSKIKAPSGPYAGLRLTQFHYDDYMKSVADLDHIKELSSPDSHVYVAGWQNWMYLHLDRPVGAHTSYYGNSEPEVLHAYYRENPDSIPEYIYLPTNDHFNYDYYEYPLEETLEKLSNMFEFEKEELDYGILLTVTGYKGEQENIQ